MNLRSRLPMLLFFLNAALIPLIFSACQAQPAPDRGPIITLLNPPGPAPVPDKMIFLSGTVHSASPIVSLVIQNQTVPLNQHESFVRMLPLFPGPNQLVIAATDAASAAASLILDVTATPEAPSPGKNALRLVLLPVETKTAEPVWTELFASMLYEKVQASRRFRVTDRGEMETALREFQMTHESLASRDSQVRLGRLLIADALLSTRLEATPQASVACRLTDVGTGEILWNISYPLSQLNTAVFDQYTEGIALDLGRLLVNRQAPVVDPASCPGINIALGGNEGVRPGLRVARSKTPAQRIGVIDSIQDYASHAILEATACPLDATEEVLVIGVLNVPPSTLIRRD